MWPPARRLEARHIQNCRLVEDRRAMLTHMPRRAVCAELGVLRGEFSREILDITHPSKLHLIDIAADAVTAVTSRFTREIADGIVQVHQGDSAEIASQMPAGYFDWVYIDADHTYDAVKRDLDAAGRTLKPGGLIALNDYIYFAPSDFAKYGVVEAVNEWCVAHDFELLFFALQGRMYNDVVIREIPR
jgi:predicted O-methyltransferase YrrM